MDVCARWGFRSWRVRIVFMFAVLSSISIRLLVLSYIYCIYFSHALWWRRLFHGIYDDSINIICLFIVPCIFLWAHMIRCLFSYYYLFHAAGSGSLYSFSSSRLKQIFYTVCCLMASFIVPLQFTLAIFWLRHSQKERLCGTTRMISSNDCTSPSPPPAF